MMVENEAVLAEKKIEKIKAESAIGRLPKPEFLYMKVFAENVERNKLASVLDSCVRRNLLEVIELYARRVSTEGLVELLGEVAERAGIDDGGVFSSSQDEDGDKGESAVFNCALGEASLVRDALRKYGKRAEGLPLERLSLLGSGLKVEKLRKKQARTTGKPRKGSTPTPVNVEP